jgi:hypothetical protein
MSPEATPLVDGKRCAVEFDGVRNAPPTSCTPTPSPAIARSSRTGRFGDENLHRLCVDDFWCVSTTNSPRFAKCSPPSRGSRAIVAAGVSGSCVQPGRSLASRP